MWRTTRVSGVHLDQLYRSLEQVPGRPFADGDRSPIGAMFNWPVRKRMVFSNPALAADPPRVKSRPLDVPSMTDGRTHQERRRTVAFSAVRGRGQPQPPGPGSTRGCQA
jgi:hypothetical protein